MNNPLFSIVIPTYNRASLLQRCLQSVVSQTYNNWEAIIVDNYSEDNTDGIVKSFQDDRIVFVKNHNYGIIAASRNKALDIAKGEWICFLDSDDCWLPNKLECMLPYLNDYDLIYHGYMQNIPKRNLWHKRNRYFYEIKEVSVGYVLQRGDPINPSCSCVRRESIGNIRFSEDRELIAVEDYDFFLQLLTKSVRVKYLKEVLTLYDMSGCSHTEAACERDAILFKKWDSYLNKDEKKEVEIQLLCRQVEFLLQNGDYAAARKLYREIFKSAFKEKKLFAVKGMIKSWIRVKRIF